MDQGHSLVLIVSGPVGVGKTAVSQEIGNLLERDDVPHTVIDLDGLTATFPCPEGDPHGTALALENLRAIWPNCFAAGSRNLIVARVMETDDDVERLAPCVPKSRTRVARLRASPETLLARVDARATGLARDWERDRALELGTLLEACGPGDPVIETDT